jgi:hypothetical protein
MLVYLHTYLRPVSADGDHHTIIEMFSMRIDTNLKQSSG